MTFFTVTTTLRTFAVEAAGIGDAMVIACAMTIDGETIEDVSSEPFTLAIAA